MSGTDTGAFALGVPEIVPPTDHRKRQAAMQVDVWPCQFGLKPSTFGCHGSLRSMMIWPLRPESRDMKTSLRELSTVSFSPSQNWVSTVGSGMTALMSASLTWLI